MISGFGTFGLQQPECRGLGRVRHGTPIQHADRVSLGGGVDRAGVCGRAALTVTAEGAAQLTVIVFVDTLADQEGAMTAVTVLDFAGDVTQAAAQECELELRHIADGGLHGMTFGWEERIPAQRWRVRDFPPPDAAKKY